MGITLKTILQALNEHSKQINDRIDSLENKMNERFES